MVARAEIFTELAVLESAGVSASRAFDILATGPNAKIKNAASTISRAITEGQALAAAGVRSGLFSPWDALLIEPYAAAGKLEAAYRYLSEQYQARVANRRAMVARLSLPLGMLGLSLFIAPLPELVRGQMSLGQYLVGAIARCVLLGVLIRFTFHLIDDETNKRSGSWIDPVVLRVPWFGNFIRRRSSARFQETLGLLLKAGIPILSAIPQASEVVTNRSLRIEIMNLHYALANGRPWHLALMEQSVFSSHEQALLVAGEAAGRLPDAVLRCAAMARATCQRSDAAIALWVPRVVYFAVVSAMISTFL